MVIRVIRSWTWTAAENVVRGCHTYYTGKTGNPRIALILAEDDHEHLVKFRNFLNCSNDISSKKSRIKGKTCNQFTIRFTSKRLAGKLIAFGVTHRKSLTAKVIGLEDDKHFWRGVLDGNGHIKNKDGKDGDKVIVTGSDDLMRQFKDFIERNIAGSVARLKQYANYYRLFIYSYTARMLLKLLYADCHIALDRKLAQARRMFSYFGPAWKIVLIFLAYISWPLWAFHPEGGEKESIIRKNNLLEQFADVLENCDNHVSMKCLSVTCKIVNFWFYTTLLGFSRKGISQFVLDISVLM